jgi:hypothetical protein
LNKFLIDDKGATALAVYGLPPLAHGNDARRGCFAALLVARSLRKLGLRPRIGVATGTAFCGVVGGRGRREYRYVLFSLFSHFFFFFLRRRRHRRRGWGR